MSLYHTNIFTACQFVECTNLFYRPLNYAVMRESISEFLRCALNVYDKYLIKLQYPVNIKNNNPKLAKAIIDQLGGPDGELAAAMRYLNQRYDMPYAQVKGVLTDIGTEELAHRQ